METILDNNYYDFIISNRTVPSYNAGNHITKLNNTHSLLHILKKNMLPCDLGVNAYRLFPMIFTLESSSAGLYQYEMGSEHLNPSLGLFGLGIIIGIVDTGIDYQHPAFKNNDNSTRILSIWDQTQENSNLIPEGFTFGAEYSKELINLALKSENPLSIVPTVDTVKHGTLIASIVAGKPNREISFSGVVPQADLAVVKLKEAKKNLENIFFVSEDAVCYAESDIILGFEYLISVARKKNRPLVICFTLGSSQGGHDGYGILSSYLDYLVKLPLIDVIVSAGNEGDNSRHYYNKTSIEPYINDFQLNIGNRDKRFAMEIWVNTPGRLAIEISAPNRESTQRIYPKISECETIHFRTNQTTVWINNIIFEEETGEQLILVRFDDPVPGIWFFQVINIDDEPFEFHSWLPSGNLISNDTYFFNANPDTTITCPGNGRFPLTVTAYNQLDDTNLLTSSRGYTRNNRIKPDIAAPGYQLPCAIPQNQYGMLSGTGAAAAYAAGVAAMVMEWGYNKGNYTPITGNQINRVMARGARRDDAYMYPNTIWGYGRLDVEEIFNRLSIV